MTTVGPRATRVAVLAAVVLAVTGPRGVVAQETFAEAVEVTEVEVPVRVLVDGEPLRGLTREDFEIYDDGEPREIVGFEVRDRAAGRFAAPAAGAAPAGGRRLLVLVDFSFARRIRLGPALERIRASLSDLLGPRDRLAVATFGRMSGLNLLVGFTDRRDTLDLAFDAVEAMLDAKRRRQRDLLADLHAARFATSSAFQALAAELSPAAALALLGGPVLYDEAADGGVAVREQRSFFAPIEVRLEVDVTEPINTAQDLVREAGDLGAVRFLGLSLTELALLLRDVGGEKELLLLSEGFSGSLLRDPSSLFYLQKALRALGAGRWTVHGIDVGGIPGIDEAGFAAESMLFFADATGGDLIENTNDFRAATEELLDRTGVVYVLTFHPPAGADAPRFRPLEVRLTRPRPGARLVHRSGYNPGLPPARREVFARRADVAEALLTNLDEGSLPVEVAARTLFDPLGGARVEVAVELPGAALLERLGGGSAHLELQLVVEDAERRVRDLLTARTELAPRGAGERLAGGGLRFTGGLGLPPGDYTVRISVVGHRSGEHFLGTHLLTVPPAPPAEAPPPLPDRSDWITVEAESRAAYFR